MRASLRILTLIYFLFIFLLSLSGMSSGVIGIILYLSAFVLPLLSVFLVKRYTGVNISSPSFKINRSSVKLMLPLLIPILLLAFALACVTSYVFSLIGYSEPIEDVSGNIALVILRYAFFPAILEELLFRFLPIALLAKISKKNAIIYSALFFAFAHVSITKLPYALIAGIIFAAIDIAFNSIMPSLLLHFFNNLISVMWMRYYSVQGFVPFFLLVFVFLSLISIVYIVISRKKYSDYTLVFRDDSDSKIALFPEPVIFFLTTFAVAIITLFGGTYA